MFSAATKTGSQPSAAANYIEDVFSTYLYTGNGSTQTIVNGLSLSTKGGLVWTKSRTYGDNGGTPGDHVLWDSSVQSPLNSNTTNAAANSNATSTSGGVNSFTSTGFVSKSAFLGANYCTWSFAKQPKFFDVVTYTGTGSAQNINHNLGSIPGMIVVKRTDAAGAWVVYHKGLNSGVNPENYQLILSNTNPQSSSSASWWNSTAPTSTQFTVGTYGISNTSGGTYVAYLFAHNAGGFGTTGTDNVISCGSYTGPANVNLGWEPQWILTKKVTNNNGVLRDWMITDVMRGLKTSGKYANGLFPNTTGAETSDNEGVYINSTGFTTEFDRAGSSGESYIYMAIRRPMKVPTDATTVFIPVIATSSGSAANTVTTNFPVDLSINQLRNGYFAQWFDRLRGDSQSSGVYLRSANTNAEATYPYGLGFDNNTGYVDNYNWNSLGGGNYVYWNFSRRPGFFDEICYTGTGTTQTLNHNLGVVPELIIQKGRSVGTQWWTWAKPVTTPNSNWWLNYSRFNGTDSFTYWGDTSGIYSAPTATTLTYGGYAEVNGSGNNFVTYLFATCAGVSKVGSYTGNGTTQTINCGFTGGARFVLIKRTDASGDWYVYDTARGMTTLTDPYLLMNSFAGETATLGSVTTTTGGFTVNAAILAAINTSGASYIFLAIA